MPDPFSRHATPAMALLRSLPGDDPVVAPRPRAGHHPRPRPRRRWTVNGDFLGLKQTGVARYAREVVTALDRLVDERHPLTRDVDLRIVAPCRGADPLRLRCIPLSIVPELRPRLPQVWVQFQLPWHAPGGLLSFCNLAPVAVRRQIVCIHDLQTVTAPESYGRLFRWMHRLVLPRLGRRAARITTVSELSRVQLAEHGVAPLAKTVVTYNGADHAARWRAQDRPPTAAHRRPFVFGFARREAHKNMDLLRRLAGPLDALGIDIALAGDADAFASPEVLPSNLILLGRLSDDDIATAFDQALCFLFPSRTEGFGLPAVEAMVCGCPVVASTAPCLPEICGTAALYADPDDPADWVAAIRSLMGDERNRADLVAAGRQRARRYVWREIAETYLRLMADIDAAPPGAARATR